MENLMHSFLHSSDWFPYKFLQRNEKEIALRSGYVMMFEIDITMHFSHWDNSASSEQNYVNLFSWTWKWCEGKIKVTMWRLFSVITGEVVVLIAVLIAQLSVLNQCISGNCRPWESDGRKCELTRHRSKWHIFLSHLLKGTQFQHQ